MAVLLGSGFLFAIAERLNITRILTLDRRDFQMIRPKHLRQFRVISLITPLVRCIAAGRAP